MANPMSARQEMLGPRGWLLALSGTVLAFVVLTHDLWALRCIFKWDAWNQFWPWFNYLAESLAQGRFPLWDPRPNCGFPFFAEPQTGVFYPPLLIAAKLFRGGHGAYQYFWLLHWLWGTLGFFFLGKRLGFSPAAAFVGSVLFAFNGFFIGNAEHTGVIVTASFVPWTLLLLDVASQGSVLYAFPAGVMLGLTGLGGNPTMTMYSVVMIAAWCLIRYRLHRKTLLILTITFAITAIVLSPAFLSFLVETRGYTERSGYLSVAEACGLNRFTWDALISLIAPSVFVNYPQLFDVPVPTIPMLNGYMGIFTLCALAVALWNGHLRRTWAWLLVFMLVAFLFSLGTAGGLRVIAYYALPFLKFVRHTGISRVFWMLGGAILAAAFFQELLGPEADAARRDAGTAQRVLIVLGCALVATLAWVWTAAPIRLEHSFDQTTPTTATLAALLGSVGVQVLVVGLFMLAFSLCRRSPGTMAATILAAVIVADCAIHLQTCRETVCWNTRAGEVATGLDRLSRERMALPLSATAPRSGRPGFFNLWAFDGKSYVRTYLAATSGAYDTLVGNTWPPYQETAFLKALEKMPRFLLISHALFVDERNAEALAFLRNNTTQDRIPLFVHDVTRAVGPASLEDFQPGPPQPVEVVSYAPEQAVLKVQAPQSCWLFASERFAPAWQASLDGKAVPLFKANFAFRAIEIPAGTHLVKMTYAPWLYKPLLVLSWGLIACILIVWAGAAVRHSIAGRHMLART